MFQCIAPDSFHTAITVIFRAGGTSPQSCPLPPTQLQCRLCGIAFMWLATTPYNLERVSSTACWRMQVWSRDATAARSSRATDCRKSWISTLPTGLLLSTQQCTVISHWPCSTNFAYWSEIGLRSADAPSADVPSTRTLLGDRAFSVAGPRAWNSLPLHVRSAQSMLTFRKLLKSNWFQRAYQHNFLICLHVFFFFLFIPL
jgi:hypothetical protein